MSDAARIRDAQIKRLAGLSSVIAAVLAASDTMITPQKETALHFCAELADNVLRGLDDLIDGAA